MKLKQAAALIIFILIPLAVGFLASFATTANIPTWYAGLNKPFFNPPNWLFAPVWTTLYILMGIASYLVYRKQEKPFQSRALKIYALQLMLNFAWSFIFFQFKLIGLALVEIITLWVVLFLTIRAFAKVSPVSAYLLYPYLAWVSFATLLNAAILLLN